jgi:hypothetical protein
VRRDAFGEADAFDVSSDEERRMAANIAKVPELVAELRPLRPRKPTSDQTWFMSAKCHYETNGTAAKSGW